MRKKKNYYVIDFSTVIAAKKYMFIVYILWFMEEVFVNSLHTLVYARSICL